MGDLKSVCWFPVNLNAEVSVFFSPDCTVQEGQAGLFCIFALEFDIVIRTVEVG